ncbi:hypothetical protein V1477_005261, partial [Vespula maculifrons]
MACFVQVPRVTAELAKPFLDSSIRLKLNRVTVAKLGQEANCYLEDSLPLIRHLSEAVAQPLASWKNPIVRPEIYPLKADENGFFFLFLVPPSAGSSSYQESRESSLKGRVGEDSFEWRISWVFALTITTFRVGEREFPAHIVITAMEATVAVAVPVATCAANYLIPINDLVSVGPSSTRTHIGKEKEEFQVGGRERWMKREGPLFGASFRSRPKSVVEPYGMAHDERLRGFLILLGEHASRYYLE